MKNLLTRDELYESEDEGDLEFTASHLADGQHIQPDRILLGANKLTIISPRLFGGSEETMLYGEITDVDIDSPLVLGFSTVIIFSRGTSIKIHGFTKGKAEHIKRIIEERRGRASSGDNEDSEQHKDSEKINNV